MKKTTNHFFLLQAIIIVLLTSFGSCGSDYNPKPEELADSTDLEVKVEDIIEEAEFQELDAKYDIQGIKQQEQELAQKNEESRKEQEKTSPLSGMNCDDVLIKYKEFLESSDKDSPTFNDQLDEWIRDVIFLKCDKDNVDFRLKREDIEDEWL